MAKTTLLGIDTGGTFTDFVCVQNNEWRVHKVLSTPSEPQQAILKGIEDLGLTDQVKSGQVTLVHGTTVATNATLESKGVRTVYIGNRGLKDLLLIGRQTRSELYSLTPNAQQVPVETELLLEVSARLAADGSELTAFEPGELDQLVEQIQALDPKAVAINLLFSFKNPAHEQAIEARLGDQYFVSRSSAVLPEYKEFERGVATWINAWLGPLIRTYLQALSQALAPAPISIMQSSGLSISADQASSRAVNLLLSGPAGGLSAAQHIGARTGQTRLLTFDMGGTSTDVALIEDRFKLTNTGNIANMPIAVPMADIHTIGAGGGSIAYLDSGGLLRVGPESAGAHPGPACYDRGGEKPTVTDANLVLGRLSATRTLADGLQLNLEKAESAINLIAEALGQSIREVAEGIIDIANEHMVQALRVISVQRGHDPREFTLMCFGGAGGLHLCDLADSLEMTTAMVPRYGGVLSALGMLTTKPGRELVQTVQQPIADLDNIKLNEVLDKLASSGEAELNEEGVSQINRADSLDLRYEGQTFTLNLPYDGSFDSLVDEFHAAHKKQHGHQMPRPVEILNGRVHLEAQLAGPELNKMTRPHAEQETETVADQIDRELLQPQDSGAGPLLIIEAHSSTFVKAGWHYKVDDFGHLLLTKAP